MWYIGYYIRTKKILVVSVGMEHNSKLWFRVLRVSVRISMSRVKKILIHKINPITFRIFNVV